MNSLLSKSPIVDVVRMVGATTFTLLVALLVFINIFGIEGAAIKTWFVQAFSTKPQSVVAPKQSGNPKSKGTEIRHYSEFVTIKHPTLGVSIVTGIRYADSVSRKIEAQWCYARKNTSSKDGLSLSLTLREIKNGKSANFAPHSVQTLRELNLKQDQARSLIKYCRFK